MKLNEKNAEFAVVKTAAHGGGTASFHISLEQAERKANSLRGSCTCGCCAVVPVTQTALDEMLHATDKYGTKKYWRDHIVLYADIKPYSPDMHYQTICK